MGLRTKGVKRYNLGVMGLGKMGWLTRRAFLAGASATVAGCVLPSAGDVCDIFREKGKYVCYDDMLAEEVGPVDVAKVNHHGCDSLSRKLVAALRPKLWTACTWEPHHMSPPTMALLTDRTIYPGPCTIATEAHGRHHVLTVIVPRGGTAFHIQNEELP